MEAVVAALHLDLVVGEAAGLAGGVLSVSGNQRGPVGSEFDLDRLPIALVLAKAKQILRVVVEPEPVLKPNPAPIAGDLTVESPGVAFFPLHPPRIAQHVRSHREAVVLTGLDALRVACEQRE